MKTRLLPLSVVMILSAILSGCSLLDFLHDDDDKDDNGDKVFTEIPELTDDNYEEVIEAIDYRLDDFLAKGIEKPEDALPYIDELRQENWVEDVRLSEDAIVISVKNGGDIIIAEPDELGIGTDESRCNGIVNPDELLNNLNANLKLTVDKLSSFQNGGEIDSKELDRSLMLNSFQSTTCNESDKIGQTLKGTHFSNNHSSSISPQVMSEGLRPNSKLLYGCKNRKVLIANTTDGDITYREMTTYLDGIYSLLSSYFGIFDVDYIKGDQVTPIFLRDHLTDYGLIILVAHGFRETGTKKTYILTDLRWHGNSGIVADNSVGFEWKDRNIAILKSGDGNLYWTLPPEYFNSIKGQYEENSIMISIVCNSLTYENNIGDNLLSKGLGAYIGYKGSVNTEVGKYGLSIILRLFANPANYKQFEFKKEDSPELSLKESFEMYDESPYFDKDMVCSAVLKTNKEDIAIFSTISEAEEVNLGLLSNFASHNLGANSPEQSGKFYEVYADGNYLLDGYITGSQYDFVKKSMGSKWYTPTSIDYGNLISLCAHDYKFKYKGVLGARLLGPSGESIFLPYPGFKIDNKKIGANILAYYPCGDMSLPVEYDPNQLEWNEQDHAIMGLADSRLTVYNYDGEFMNFLQNCFHNNLINANRLVWIDIDAGAKKVIITETERLKFSYQFVLRPAKRNLFYKEQWNQFDKEMDKSLKRIKRVTLDDIKKAAKLHYPDYKIVVE